MSRNNENKKHDWNVRDNGDSEISSSVDRSMIEQGNLRGETSGQIAGRYFYEIFVRGLLAGTCAGITH